MNRTAIIALSLAVALLAAFAAGWFYGSRSAASRRAQEADAAYALSTARGMLLEGRIELYRNNFGNASSLFDQAKRQLAQAIELLDRGGAGDQAGALRQADTTINVAIQHANRLEPSAHEPASSAQKAIDAVIARRSAVQR